MSAFAVNRETAAIAQAETQARRSGTPYQYGPYCSNHATVLSFVAYVRREMRTRDALIAGLGPREQARYEDLNFHQMARRLS